MTVTATDTHRGVRVRDVQLDRLLVFGRWQPAAVRWSTRQPSQWTGGFTASVAITNTGSSAISSWTLKFTFPGNQAITNAWNGVESQSGENVTISNESYNGAIAAGGSTSLGFQGTWSTSDAAPTAFTVNGNSCTT